MECDRFRSGWVVIISALIGFIFGSTLHVSWQQAVEGAQAVSGIVPYPHDNLFYYYQIKTWTLMHQIPALFLRLGVSEYALSVVISGIMGALTYSCLALAGYVFSRSVWFSLAMVFAIHEMSLASFGATYTLELMGVSTTYGIVGTAWDGLAFFLFCAGFYSWAGGMLALAPAIHPSMGVYSWILIAWAYGVSGPEVKEGIRRMARGFFIGLAGTLASAGVYWIQTREVHWPFTAEDVEVLKIFFYKWDDHRRQTFLQAVNDLVPSLTLFWLFERMKREDRAPWKEFLHHIARGVFVFGCLGLILNWIPPHNGTARLHAWMPARVFTLNILMLPAIFFGWLFSDKKSLIKAAGLALSLAVMTGVSAFYGSYHAVKVIIWTTSLCGISWAVTQWPPSGENRILQKGALVFRGACLLFCLWLGFQKAQVFWQPHDRFDQEMLTQQQDPPIQEALKGSGALLLSPDLNTHQLLTRRPVVLDVAATDGMAYVPAIASETANVLKEIYGIDFWTSPGGEWIHQEVLDQRTPEEWKRLSIRYGFKQILTSMEWNLKLPLRVAGEFYKLYDVPQD